MKVLLVLALLVAVAQAFIFVQQGCKADADCGKDGCCHHRLFKNTCQHKLHLMSRCLLKNAQATCQNTCTAGLQCIDEGKLDIAMEPSYQNGNYGRCMTPGSVGHVTDSGTMSTSTPSTTTPMVTMADE